jgi:CRISPR-associated protein Cas5d
MSEGRLIRLLVEGERACFRRSEFTAALVSYDVLPPLFAIKTLENVLGWQFQYQPLRLHVLRPIRFTKEVLAHPSGDRLAWVLLDVAYVIEALAHPLDANGADPSIEFASFLGLPSMPAAMRLLASDEPIISEMARSGSIDLGWLPYRRATKGLTTFCRLTMLNGLIDLDRSTEDLMLCE